MKKYFNNLLAAFALVALSVACNKADPMDHGIDDQSATDPAVEMVTISATLTDAGTRVSFDPTFDNTTNKPTGMAHTWEAGDKLRVFDASDHNVYADYTLDQASIGSSTGTFTGPSLSASSYDVQVVPTGGPFTNGNTQIQASDGATAHLEFIAGATGVTDLTNIMLNETSSVVCFIVKLPQGAAAGIEELVIETSNDGFATHPATLTVQITTAGDTDNDDILKVYANVPAGWSLLAGTEMFLRFSAPNNNSHKIYTRYQVFPTAITSIPGKFNYIKMNCEHIDQYAGKDDDGTQAHPYLIADPYQLKAVQELASTTAKTYFKMVDNVDMSGMTGYVPVNDGVQGYSQVVDFNGNNKTISHLGSSMFYVFKGYISNLTLDSSTIGSGSQRGVLAQYIQGTGNEITNVDITGCKVTGGTNSGALIGRINSGTAGVVTATISDCDVTDTSVKGGCAGGLLGSVEAKVIVSNCSYSGNTVQGLAQKIGGLVGITSDNIGCSFTGCRVESATVDASGITGDARAGGFIGQHGEGSYIYGCTVGTSSENVNVKAGAYDTTNSNPVNTGGFVGVNYGIISKDVSDNHSKAYVTVTSTNTTGKPINLGGFAGFQRGTIEYSDAVLSMGDTQGQYIGGFCGYIVYQSGKTVKTDHCTVCGDGDSNTVDIRGNNFTGGFVGVAESGAFTISNCNVLPGTVIVGQSSAGGFAGQIKSGTVEDCSADVTFQSRGGNNGGFVGALTGGTVQRCSSAGTLSQISSTNSTFGGFAGYVNGVDLKKCSSTMDVTVARSYVGGLIGDFQTANTVSECFYNGTISGPANTKGGLIGTVAAVAATITNCYTSGELVGSSGTQIYGGIVGELKAGASVTNCYSTMDMSHGGRAMGGIVGRACNAGWDVSSAAGNTVSDCIAWNPAITYDGTPGTSASSGAIVGYTSFKNILKSCYRRSDMAYLNSNTAVGTTCQTTMVDQVDCDGTNWAVNGNRPAGTTPAGTSASAQYQAPYYGVAAASTATVSSVAQSLGWDSTVWDFSNALPTLR